MKSVKISFVKFLVVIIVSFENESLDKTIQCLENYNQKLRVSVWFILLNIFALIIKFVVFVILIQALKVSIIIQDHIQYQWYGAVLTIIFHL